MAERETALDTRAEADYVLAQLELAGMALRSQAKDTGIGGEAPAQVLRECAESFSAFLPYWKFKNRDTSGARSPVLTFGELWPGQQRFADLMVDKRPPDYPNGPWIFALKAGKLGFTELECAWDAWVAMFRCANARVHLFSRDHAAAKEMMRIVKFGLLNLPKFFGVHIPRGEADSDTTTSVRLLVGPVDTRIIKAYATGEKISIDLVAHHVHLDEWAHMAASKAIWEDVQTTVAPDGTLHIVTRGAGDDADVRELWEAAESGQHELVPFFAGWWERPDRDQLWYDRTQSRNTTVGHQHFAPSEASEALQGDETNEYIPVVTWDGCIDPEMPVLGPDPRGDVIVVALDAALSGDSFAVVAASRHPDHPNPCGRRHEDPAIRAVRVWKPEQFPSGRIDFRTVEGWVRVVCQGGCPGDPPNRIEAHPLYAPWGKKEGCGGCAAGVTTPAFNVIKVVYDPYQLESMMQQFRAEGVATVGAFEQGKARLVADRGLFDVVLQRRLAHHGDALMREHIGNARAKVPKDEDSKMRIVKKDSKRRVDAAVAASMACSEVLRLLL